MAVARDLHHPTRDQIDLSAVLDALSDPTRREIAAYLAAHGEENCSGFSALGSKTNLSYHLARLREAGVTRTRAEGAQRLISLRLEDLESRFPGLLTAILASARREGLAAGVLVVERQA